MKSYFIPIDENKVFFFTKEMSDEFIFEAVGFCINEIDKVYAGKPGIDMYEYAWSRVIQDK